MINVGNILERPAEYAQQWPSIDDDNILASANMFLQTNCFLRSAIEEEYFPSAA